MYKKLAEKKIKEIVGWGKLPILCGGTMLYLDMIAKNYKIPKKAPNQRLREKFSKTSLSKLIKELKKIDPPAAGIVDLKNRRRVERALELAMHGRSISEARISKPKFDILKIGIKRPREELYDKINHRVPAMIGEGLVNETEQVLKKYGPKVLAETIGYKEILDWIKTGKKSGDLAKTIEKIQTNTRHYAKRQMTWWRRDEEIRWVKDAKTAEKEIIKFISLN